jgi:site-specific DNA recombinase
VLLAADEPMPLISKRATQILTRRVKQGVAEWYVLELLEKAEDGYVVHTQQGWNIGRPPYGYLGEQVPHPVPAKRVEGKTKTRLVPDPVRAPVVARIYRWRVDERLGYAAIAERLNRDLDRYPPPQSPDPARRRDCWSRSAVYEILRNPKYTGYQVWNRRATKQGGRVNPPEAWVRLARAHPPGDRGRRAVRSRRRGRRPAAGVAAWRRPQPASADPTLLRAAWAGGLRAVWPADVRQN